jgi:hypothetical protein
VRPALPAASAINDGPKAAVMYDINGRALLRDKAARIPSGVYIIRREGFIGKKALISGR